MAGLYIHVPFCRQACYYCNFHFSTQLGGREDYVQALLKEMELRKSYLEGGQVLDTVYFGGGTPSLLDIDQLQLIMDSIHRHFRVGSSPEITLEANPDDMNTETLRSWKGAGINRLSIGIQSFFDEDLKYMNRCHSASEGADSIKRAVDTGIDNISIDLIYGTPTMDAAQWEQNLEKAIAAGVQHISSYCLTVEDGTALEKRIAKGMQLRPDEDLAADQFEILGKMLGAGGFEQYEVSNFAKDGKYGRHNSNYWKGVWYLGLGPSAHSFNGRSRQWNVANNYKYVSALNSGAGYYEKEELTRDQLYNEYVLIRLRTKWGCSANEILQKYGINYADHFKNKLQTLVPQWFRKEDGTIILTREGLLMADAITSMLMV